MASYINPRCAVPTYLLDSKSEATHCGTLEGYIYSAILTVVVIIISITMYNRRHEYDLRHNQNYHPNNVRKLRINYFFTTLALVVLIWLGVPMLGSWLKGLRWEGYIEQIKSYTNKGFSKDSAIKQIQSMHETQIHATAMTSGASSIANALRGYK
jgi:hypothetical protein